MRARISWMAAKVMACREARVAQMTYTVKPLLWRVK